MILAAGLPRHPHETLYLSADLAYIARSKKHQENSLYVRQHPVAALFCHPNPARASISSSSRPRFG
jgi:hypothetical protein|tara:strand:- start:7616 stop:7813 length:198 start_codon:yes stop_codon:yes gene_type:complete